MESTFIQHYQGKELFLLVQLGVNMYRVVQSAAQLLKVLRPACITYSGLLPRNTSKKCGHFSKAPALESLEFDWLEIFREYIPLLRILYCFLFTGYVTLNRYVCLN